MNLGSLHFIIVAVLSTSTQVVESFSSTTRPSFTRTTKLAVSSSSPVPSFTPRTAGKVETADVIDGPELPALDSTSKRLFLVRHGEVINPGGDRAVFYGAQDVSLSNLGKQEASVAGEYLAQFDLENICASPLSRAVYGANQVLKQQQSSNAADEPILYSGFRELDRGAWCGQTLAEIGPERMKQFDACDESVTPKGGESYPQLKRRVMEAHNAVLEKTSPGRASVIVSHLQVTRSIVSDALGMPSNQMASIPIATASITCIDYHADGTTTVQFQSFKPNVGLRQSVDGAN